MAQHDQVIDNGSGASVRSDINNALAAAFSLSSGSTAPSTTVAHMLWADTTNGVLKRRNAANSGWLVVAPLASTMAQSKSTAYTVAASDFGTLLDCSSTFTLSLTDAATLGDGFYVDVRNSGSGLITIDPALSQTIDGVSTQALAPGQSCRVYCNGASFKTVGLGKVAQVVNVETGALATGITILPGDDTIPQNTEGDQYMSLAITPTNPNSTLLIDVAWNGSHSAGGMNVALFQDSGADAIAAAQVTAPAAGSLVNVPFRHKMAAGTTSATTFEVRAGAGVAGTTTFNGSGGTRVLGGVMASSITITEILP